MNPGARPASGYNVMKALILGLIVGVICGCITGAIIQSMDNKNK